MHLPGVRRTGILDNPHRNKMLCITCYVPTQTLSSLRRNGCLGGIPVVVLLGVGSAIGAGAACWRDGQELPAQADELLPADTEPPPAHNSATSGVTGAT